MSLCGGEEGVMANDSGYCLHGTCSVTTQVGTEPHCMV